MGMPHKVDLDEMLAWLADEKNGYVIYASSSSGKRLYVKLSGGYLVEDGARTVYDGTDGRSAVNAYNDIP